MSDNIDDANKPQDMSDADYEQYLEMTKMIDNLDDSISKINEELCDEKCQIEKKIKECRENQLKTTQEYIRCENIIRSYRNEYEINISDNEEEFKNELDKLIYNLKYNHELTKDNIIQFISDYKTNIIFYNKLLTLYNKIKGEKSLYNEKIDTYNKIINTSDRKTFYEDENINTITNRKYFLLIFYWLILLFLAYKLLYVNHKFKDPFILFQIFILSLIPIYGLYYIKFIIFYVYNKLKLLYYKYISFK